MVEFRMVGVIVAVRVVGYSCLIGENEAGTAQGVREHRERPLAAAAAADEVIE